MLVLAAIDKMLLYSLVSSAQRAVRVPSGKALGRSLIKIMKSIGPSRPILEALRR